MQIVVIGADQDCRDSPQRQSYVLGRTIRPFFPPQPKLDGCRRPTGPRLRWAPTAGANHSGCPASPDHAPSRCAISTIAEGEANRCLLRASHPLADYCSKGAIPDPEQVPVVTAHSVICIASVDQAGGHVDAPKWLALGGSVEKSCAVTAPPVSRKIAAATLLPGQLSPLHRRVINDGETPTRAAKAIRVMFCEEIHSANFMPANMRQPQIQSQEKFEAG